MSKAAQVLIFILVQVSFIFALSEAKLSILEPQPASSFNITSIQKDLGSCSYTVVVNTSCSSPIFTRDQISIAFGDATGNQVYASRLDEPTTGTFEQCSSDRFQINGSCVGQICYVFLYRTGIDGWQPETVKIYGPDSKAITFYFNKYIPSDMWYGYNFCEDKPEPKPSSSHNLFGRLRWFTVISEALFLLCCVHLFTIVN